MTLPPYPPDEPDEPEEPDGVQNIVVESGFAYGVIGADLHVFRDQGPLYLLTVHGQRPPVDPVDLRKQPSRMLTAAHRIVTFTGRGEERRALTAWREDPEQPGLAVKWLHGPGGQGKTRLADELAEQSIAEGWKVVHARHGAGSVHPPPGSQDLRLRFARGLLVVVDYADRWPASHLTWFLSNALLHQSVPTRVLMLARSLRPWDPVQAALATPPIRAGTSVTALLPVSATAGSAERTHMFTVARDCFGARYAVPPAELAAIEPPRSLAHSDFGLVLALHMAALVAVDAHCRKIVPPEGLADLSAYLLGRERLHWSGLCESGVLGFRTPVDVMARTVFGAALAGPLPRREGKAILGVLDLEGHPDRLLDDHAVCYPAQDARNVLEPLYPDRLCEDFLALMLPGHSIAHVAADSWSDEAVQQLLRRAADGSPPAHLPRAVTFLASAAAPGRWRHVTHCLAQAFLADPRLALDAGGAALSAVADAMDEPVLSAIDEVLPPDRHVDLDVAVAAVVARLVDLRLAEHPDPATTAALHAKLGYRTLHSGEYETSAAAYATCVRIRRELAESDPQMPGALAKALNNFGNALSHLGRSEEALAAYTEAVQIRRPLVPQEPGEHWRLFATELQNLGSTLSECGRHQEGHEAIAEAVGIRRALAAANSELFGADLAGPLTNLGDTLARIGRQQEALQAHLEAVSINRGSAAADPAAHEPDLAGALLNLSGLQLEIGLYEEGCMTAEEAVTIMRRLAHANPAVFEPELAGALTNLRICLSELGSMHRAREACTEAVAIHRRLAPALPDRFEPQLAAGLVNLAFHLHHDGQHVQAARAGQDARSLYQAMRARSVPFPAADYAGCLESLSTCLYAAGDRAAAVAPAADAVRERRGLAASGSTVEQAELADTLKRYGDWLGAADRGHEALAAYEEAVTLHHRVAASGPAQLTHRTGHAKLLRSYGLRLSIEGLHREAYSATTDAVSAFRGIERHSPGHGTGELVLSLRQLGLILLWPQEPGPTEVPLRTRHRRRQGLEASAEAVSIRRRQAEADPDRFRPELTTELISFAQLRMAAGIKQKDALEAMSEAIQILQQLARSDPAAYGGRLAEAVAAGKSWQTS
ncbi:tetratricopeptide repeat protein [Streptomyces sp. BF23-19]|uniref:tetratricopeptide repeat protein n=1 Tax=unclassified Streptomyces TaxID=2593676 RepID=UPI0034E48961